jgi:myo-inositol 2-dehydrogenase / D-chiro-inositol 1-dehydrogenase
MDNTTVNLGLIGAGRIGRVHAEHICQFLAHANLVVVADASETVARDCAERLQIPEHTVDFRRVTDHPDVEAVVICSPTDTHLEVILAAAAAGKHIFCEKPIDQDLARIDQALTAVNKAHVVFQVGFNRRFDANFRRVRRAVVDGEIGTPHQLHLISRDPAPPSLDYVKQSGGIFADMTIHDFDMARFLVRDEVVRVYATGAALVDPRVGEAGDLDTATVLLEFAQGAVGVIENSRRAVYGYDQRVEVFGSGGSVRTDNNYPNSVVLSGAKSVRRDLPLNFFMERYLASYLLEMEQFVEAARRGGPSPVSGEEGRIPVLMAIAARKSWELKRPVSLVEVEQT